MSTPPPKILAFAGSLREGSYNKAMVRIAADGAREAGAEVTLVTINEFELPLYNGDDEAARGLPEGARRLKHLLRDHDGFLIASPEYNSSITGPLKNAIDWASRAEAGEPALVAYRGKAAVIMSASPGSLGGLRGLVHLRAILGNIGVIVLPEQLAISNANEVFHDDGSLREPEREAGIKKLGQRLAAFLQQWKAGQGEIPSS